MNDTLTITRKELDQILAKVNSQNDAIIAKLKERLNEQEQASIKMEHNWLDQVSKERDKLEEHTAVYRAWITGICVVSFVAFMTMFIWMSERAVEKVYQTECRVRGGITVVNVQDTRMCVNANALIKMEAR